MHKNLIGDVKSGKGVLEKIVPMPEMARRFRAMDSMDTAMFEQIYALMRRHAEESTIRKDALWKELMEHFGYQSLEHAHDAGKSFSVEHVTGNVMMFGTPATSEGGVE